MRKSLLVLLLLSLTPVRAAEAPVVLVTRDCQDYFVVDLGGKRHTKLEWYGGYRPEKGDIVVGDFSHFGVQDMTVAGKRLRGYVEEYDLTQDAINDKLAGKC